MIKMNYGFMTGKNSVINADAVFDSLRHFEWIEDPFVKEIISDIDKSSVYNKNIIIDKRGDAYPPQGLCGGTKMLILMYKWNSPDRVFDLSWCGDNCAKYFQRIAEKQDVRVFHTNIFGFDENEPFNVLFEQTKLRTDSIEEYEDEFYRLMMEDYERSTMDRGEN